VQSDLILAVHVNAGLLLAQCGKKSVF